MLSTNIKDWSHWQYKISEAAIDSWQNMKIPWTDFSHPGWGAGMEIKDVSENLNCIEGFKFVLKNETGDSIIISDLAIDDIRITAN